MSLLDVIGLVVVAALTAFLFHRHNARLVRRDRERGWPGHGMDVRPVSARIERLRRNFPAVAQARPHDLKRRLRLHEQAGRALRRFAYFRTVEPQDSPATKHDTHSQAA